MRDLTEIFMDGGSRTVIILLISGISILISFFGIGDLPFNTAWIAILLCGVPILVESIIGLIKHRDIKAGILVSIALIASIMTGEIFAAGEIAFIMVVGEALEQRTVKKAHAGIKMLIDLAPQTARIVCEGREEIIPATDVKIGDIIRVLAGETIPSDGTVVGGRTSVDQSVLTGEPLPVDKDVDDSVFSGTVNQFGTFEMKATAIAEDSSLQRMIQLVQSADAGKAKIVRTADRWATYIVAAALIFAVLAWIFTGDILRAVTVLVVFCPCALVLATPTAIVAAIGNVSRHRILIKEGDAIERLSVIDHIIFDKTGTLTYGRPSVTFVRSVDPQYDDDEILKMAASAELRSEHPLGKAVVRYSKEHSIDISEPSDFDLIIGRGVSAIVDNILIKAGNLKFMYESGIDIPHEIMYESQQHQAGSFTVIFISADNSLIGYLVLSDTLRENASTLMGTLDEMGISFTLLTGDDKVSADNVACRLNIDDVMSGCLPEDKMEYIRRAEENGERICMIGDGINDAPALKAATVGIAMGEIGSDIAIDAADVALIGDDIENIPHLIRLSKKTMRTIRMNLTMSMLLNFIAIGLAMAGVLTPVTGALVHNAGSILVILNSALLIRWRYRGAMNSCMGAVTNQKSEKHYAYDLCSELNKCK